MTAFAETPAQLAQRIVPPPPYRHLLERARLAPLLAELPRRRLTALTAGPGSGKTTLFAGWAAEQDCAWYTVTAADADPLTLARGLDAALRLRVPDLPQELADSLAGMRGPGTTGQLGAFVPALAAGLHGRLRLDLVLLLDDVHLIDGSPGAVRLLADLAHMAPDRLHLAIASRAELPFPVERLLVHGQVVALTPQALAFDEDEVARLLEAVTGPCALQYARTVRALTDGVPAAVRLVAETLADILPERRDSALARWAEPDGDLLDRLLDREIIPRAAPELLTLLRVAAALDRFDADLLADLGVPDAAKLVTEARRREVLVTSVSGDPAWCTLTEVARRYAVRSLHPDADEPGQLRARAASWHLARGDAAEALRLLVALDDSAALARLLEEHGSSLLTAGHAPLVQAAVAAVRPEHRSPAIELVEGEAHQIRGDWDRAVAHLSRLVPAEGPVPVAVAWRLGLIYHMRGELAEALDLYRRGLANPDGGAARDLALTAAWAASAAWLCGAVEEGRALTERAVALAERSGDDTAAAATHTALNMLAVLDGDRRANDRHYLLALEHARRAGDVLHMIRIRSNRGSRYLEEGHYGEAFAELETSVRLAELADFPTLRTLAMVNRADAKRRLGRLDEAARDVQTVLGEQQRLGSRLASYPLVVLGDVHLDQGNTAQAQVCFEEAVRLAEAAGDQQALVPSLAGLALAVAPRDIIAAAALAERAAGVEYALGHTRALLAVAYVALRRGDIAAAGTAAEAAAQAARLRRDRPAQAESLEVRAELIGDPAQRRAALDEAEAMWAALDCPVGLARTRVALAGLLDREVARRLLTATATQCRRMGARSLARRASELLAALADALPPAVAIQTLGEFGVTRRGHAVPHGEWRTRAARELLKMVVARRGAPVEREAVRGQLWPDEDAETGTAQLDAALAAVRAVLDPGRDLPADHYLLATGDHIRLQMSHVEVDVEGFLTQAQAALDRRAAGHPAVEELSRVEARYTGDFYAEDPTAEYARVLREEARAVYLSVVRALAEAYSGTGDPEAAAGYLLRLLSQDPYDEPAHLALVRALDAAGRYGEARRMYRTYAARMAELDVEPAAYPSDG
ncbi:MAG TPA: BTAD domain-containing putative transcriptional regulator [Micromonosporaceae bacterium]|nr:BTAD domain-containing putative transcriptional regulator [Micromonosporaceae bacterium]